MAGAKAFWTIAAVLLVIILLILIQQNTGKKDKTLQKTSQTKEAAEKTKPLEIQSAVQPEALQKRINTSAAKSSENSSKGTDWQPSKENPPEKPVFKQVGIEIKDFSFNPSTITVKKGTTVAWSYSGKYKHVVFIKETKASSPYITSNASWNYTFTTAGNFSYIDAVFDFMQGRVVVE